MSSANGNKLVGARLEEGTYLPESSDRLALSAGLDFCDVTGFGVIRDVELEGPNDEAISLEGELDLLDLKGRVRRAGDVTVADYVCTLSRHTDNGIQVLGGVLRRARVEFVELTLIPLETSPEAMDAAPRPAPRKRAPEPAEVPAPVGGAPLPKKPDAAKWAEVISESQKLEKTMRRASWDDDGEDESAVPSRGDLVNHRQFGRCDVVKVTDEHISLRKPDGRTVQLGLAVLRFTEAATEGKKTVFDVSVRRS